VGISATRRGISWRLSIDEQRDSFKIVLQDNPSLNPLIETVLIHAYKLACIRASCETHLELSTFPSVCPWSIEQLIDDGFYSD
jgi:hypothetical protein